jgi:hypothetical protein
MRSIRSWLTRKQEATSCLRYDIQNILISESKAVPEVCAGRIGAFSNMQEMIVDNSLNSLSKIKATGMKSILYARFYATRGLIVKPSLDPLVYSNQIEPNLATLRNSLSKARLSDHLFKRAAQRELDLVSLETAENIANQDTYAKTVSSFLKDEEIVTAFLNYEKSAWRAIEADLNSPLAVVFCTLNRETNEYVAKNVEDDIRNMMKNRERLSTLLKRNKIIIAIIVQPLVACVLADGYGFFKEFLGKMVK